MFENISQNQLEKMLRAAQIVSETMRVLQKSETNIVGEMLKTSDNFYQWEHLPADDVCDRDSHSQYYYHAHEKSESGNGFHDDEHGHFHTFIRGKGMPDSIKPLPLNDYDPNTDINDINTHIIGIGMNDHGVPIRLFTVNRWVSGETWISAQDIIDILDAYEIDDTRPSWATNLWITNMVILFRPLIEKLIKERDETIYNWQKDHSKSDNVYEDRKLEVTSHQDIDLSQYVSALTKYAERNMMAA
ncbi:MAG: hypothetical protein AB8B83_02170 [Bdellovibrionales bacterium]